MDYLNELEKKLDLPPDEKEQVMRELRSHHEELRSELMSSGMDASSAEQQAARTVGDPTHLASRLQAVHCRATWRTALLTALPFLAMLALHLISLPNRVISPNAGYPAHWYSQLLMGFMLIAGWCMGAFFAATSIRELRHGRRPMWLATWLASGVLSLVAIGQIAVSRPTESIQARHWQMVIYTLLLGGIAVYAHRHSIRWRSLLVAWMAIALGISVLADSRDFSFWFLRSLIWYPFVAATALKVFCFDRHSNCAQASLFLFAFYYSNINQFASSDLWVSLTFSFLMVLIGTATVLVYARAAAWNHKLLALASGVILLSLVSMASLGFLPSGTVVDQTGRAVGWPTAAVPGGNMIVTLIMVVFVPMLFERRWTRQRPETVD